jgi:ectoine hydroxylase-related dioxygenase (phytanoyl-CoA dioxygenase family)
MTGAVNMPTLQTFAPGAAIDDIMVAMNRDGAVILKDAVDQKTLAEVNVELKPYIDATAVGADVFGGFKTTRTGAVMARSTAAGKLALNETVRAIADRVLLQNCDRYHIHVTQVIRIMPGQGAQPIHRDRWLWGTWLKGMEPQVNSIWALSDFTRENGATQVVVGSTGWPDDRRAQPQEIGYAEMSAGSVVVYTGSTFHGGGENISNGDRVGLNISYSLGWLRQEENQYLSVPPEVARTLDPELSKLLGYTMGRYALGYFTPPLPPGEGPEIVPPEYALTGIGDGNAMGSAEDLAMSAANIRNT